MGLNKTRLQELQQQVMRKKHVDARMKQLYAQQKELMEKVAIMKAGMLAEQDDVNCLEGRSLAHYFYRVVGKLDEKLDKERVEAYAAEVRYDAAVCELEAVTADLHNIQEELIRLGDCEEEFFLLFQEKALGIRVGGTPQSVELIQYDENIVYLENQLREIEEAMAAGRDANALADKALDHLNSAKGLSIWDLTGGGLIADALKYGQLDVAQDYIEQLQVQLRRFKTELADVAIDTKVQIGIDGFLQFADYFFDGLFADWAVMDEISLSQKRLKEIKSKIHSAMNQLTTLKKMSQQELDKEMAERELLVVEHDT